MPYILHRKATTASPMVAHEILWMIFRRLEANKVAIRRPYNPIAINTSKATVNWPSVKFMAHRRWRSQQPQRPQVFPRLVEAATAERNGQALPYRMNVHVIDAQVAPGETELVEREIAG